MPSDSTVEETRGTVRNINHKVRHRRNARPCSSAQILAWTRKCGLSNRMSPSDNKLDRITRIDRNHIRIKHESPHSDSTHLLIKFYPQDTEFIGNVLNLLPVPIRVLPLLRPIVGCFRGSPSFQARRTWKSYIPACHKHNPFGQYDDFLGRLGRCNDDLTCWRPNAHTCKFWCYNHDQQPSLYCGNCLGGFC